MHPIKYYWRILLKSKSAPYEYHNEGRADVFGWVRIELPTESLCRLSASCISRSARFNINGSRSMVRNDRSKFRSPSSISVPSKRTTKDTKGYHEEAHHTLQSCSTFRMVTMATYTIHRSVKSTSDTPVNQGKQSFTVEIPVRPHAAVPYTASP
ncbi:hypothetical protein BCR43DRAFT_233887 [Syncephalastrum racemosum]|uniref:Uncharacterized protein n=1 Tax=Syncephalastrum racemosum TaxID=13706 RepID=A0A1X2HEA1_SYNRA|nr:hypothetical protein BCR43DRAFT_233887 [Syncephalastrum racemosum]